MTGSDHAANPGLPAVTWQAGRVDVLYDALKDQILNQHWPPGAQLNISKLAQQFRVSITPVREALSRLTTDRLVVYEANQGFRIAPLPSLRRLDELGEMRLLLEMHAAELAATRRTEADLDILRATQGELAALPDSTSVPTMRTFAGLNRRFHHQIIAASGNAVLAELYEQLGYNVVTGHVYQTHGIIGLDDVIAEHAAVIAALESGDPERARTAMRQHVEIGLTRVRAAYIART